jgi:hypothetical protein
LIPSTADNFGAEVLASPGEFAGWDTSIDINQPILDFRFWILDCSVIG